MNSTLTVALANGKFREGAAACVRGLMISRWIDYYSSETASKASGDGTSTLTVTVSHGEFRDGAARAVGSLIQHWIEHDSGLVPSFTVSVQSDGDTDSQRKAG